MIALKHDTSGGTMAPTTENPKKKRKVNKISTKEYFNPPYIDRYMVNGVDGMNWEVIGVSVDDTIV